MSLSVASLLDSNQIEAAFQIENQHATKTVSRARAHPGKSLLE